MHEPVPLLDPIPGSEVGKWIAAASCMRARISTLATREPNRAAGLTGLGSYLNQGSQLPSRRFAPITHPTLNPR